MAIYIDIRCCITSPHACLVLFHRPSTTRRPHAVSTWAFPRPRHPGPPPRLLCKDSVAYINIRLSITSLHARFVLLHRPSTALRPHPLPRSRQPGPSPRPLRVSMARYIDIRWSITSPRAGRLFCCRPHAVHDAVSTPTAPDLVNLDHPTAISLEEYHVHRHVMVHSSRHVSVVLFHRL
jgi:hypothetical protein